jgi:peptide/nickel transport system permease protein
MLLYTAKRLLLALLVAVTVSVVSFTLLRLAGDLATAVAGEAASSEDIEFLRKKYGLDRPVVVQYLDWAGSALKGDLGRSFYFNEAVTDLISGRLSTTMTLGACALGFALVFAIPLGVLAALKPNTWIDRLALTFSVFGQALPTFWFALMMIILFGVMLRWLPITGSETWAHFVMPSIALGYYATPAFMRLTRAGMLDVMASDYIRTARAKGLRTGAVLFKHALRNAVLPVVSLAAVQLGFMLGGSTVIETIFALHGIGYLALESIARSDFPTVQAIVLILSLFYVVLTFLADLLNAFLDPRIRVG